MPDERAQLLMSLAQNKVPIIDWTQRPIPREWPAAGTLPPGHPRTFVDPTTGRVFAREEADAAMALDDGSSPSDRPPGMAFDPEAEPSREPLEAPPMSPERTAGPYRPPTMQMHGAWPVQQRMMAMNTEQELEGEGEYASAMRADQQKLAQLIDAKAHPQAYGPEGMRPSLARMLKASAPAADAPAPAFDNARLAAIMALSKAQPKPKSTLEDVIKGWKDSGLDDAGAAKKGEDWRATMAANALKDKQSLANRPQALQRLAEHELFRKSPRAWMMWKMTGGEQPGSPKVDAGGGYGNLAAMNYAMGDERGAELALQSDRIRAEAEHGRGQLAQAETESYRRAFAQWQQQESERQVGVAQLRESVRKDLTERGRAIDKDYQPTREAIDAAIRERGSGALLTPSDPPQAPMMPGGQKSAGQRAVAPSRAAQPGGAQEAPAQLSPKADVLRQGFNAVPPGKDAEALRLTFLNQEPSKRAEFVVDNLEALDDLSADDITGIMSGVDRKQFLKAIWDAYAVPLTRQPGWTPWTRHDNKVRLRSLLKRFGVPEDALPAAPRGWQFKQEPDSSKAKAFYESLSKPDEPKGKGASYRRPKNLRERFLAEMRGAVA